MTDYTTLTDDQLTEEYNNLFGRYMYFMAAEGNWNQETEARRATEKEYYACIQEMATRGMQI